MEKQNFKLNDRVEFDAGDFKGTGTILGKASEHIADMYIVQLDVPLPTHKACVLPEGCLKLIPKPEEEVRKSERYAIADALSHVANKIYKGQKQDYPSNILDVVCFWLKGYTWEFVGSNFNELKYMYEALNDKESV